jgi:hypothetical protein
MLSIGRDRRTQLIEEGRPLLNKVLEQLNAMLPAGVTRSSQQFDELRVALALHNRQVVRDLQEAFERPMDAAAELDVGSLSSRFEDDEDIL